MDVMKKNPRNRHRIDSLKDREELVLVVKGETELLKFLVDNVPAKRRNTIKAVLRDRQVTVDGKVVTQFDHPLHAGQEIRVRWEKIPFNRLYHGIRVVFEDRDLIVIDKPAGLLTVATETEKRRTAYSILSEYVKVLRDLSDIACLYQVRLSFEFLGFGWCSVRTPRAASEIIQRVERNNVGLTIDAAHFYGGGGLMSELEQLNPEQIFAFHLDDLEDTPKEAIRDDTRLLPGLGVVPLDDICNRLKHIGYNGSCAIELFRPEYWKWDPQELAIAARQAAIKVLSPYFLID